MFVSFHLISILIPPVWVLEMTLVPGQQNWGRLSAVTLCETAISCLVMFFLSSQAATIARSKSETQYVFENNRYCDLNEHILHDRFGMDRAHIQGRQSSRSGFRQETRMSLGYWAGCIYQAFINTQLIIQAQSGASLGQGSS